MEGECGRGGRGPGWRPASRKGMKGGDFPLGPRNAPSERGSAIIPSDPVLVVLLFSAVAAATAAGGAVPFLALGRVPMRTLGMAYALASGLMLGAGYLLLEAGLKDKGHSAVVLMSGAALGVLYTYWTHWFSRTGEMESIPSGEIPPGLGYKIVLLNALHSASEGVAIGAGMALSTRMGVFLALSLAVHNIAEAVTLTSVLLRREVRLGEAALLCVITNVPQILLAVTAFAVVSAARGLLPWALGFAAGALAYLVLTELLPDSYRQASHTWVAAAVSFSTGMVILLKGFFA